MTEMARLLSLTGPLTVRLSRTSKSNPCRASHRDSRLRASPEDTMVLRFHVEPKTRTTGDVRVAVRVSHCDACHRNVRLARGSAASDRHDTSTAPRPNTLPRTGPRRGRSGHTPRRAYSRIGITT